MIDLTQTELDAKAALIDMHNADDINQQFDCAETAVKVWRDKAIELTNMLNVRPIKHWWNIW